MALKPEERRPASPREITLPEGFIVLSYLGTNEGGRIETPGRSGRTVGGLRAHDVPKVASAPRSQRLPRGPLV